MTKTEVRKLIQERLSLLSDKKERSERIAAEFSALPEVRAAKKIALFLPMPSEPDIFPLVGTLLKQGKRLFAPQTDKDAIRFVELTEKTAYTPGRYGIREPQGREFNGDFDVMAVPLVAFDENKNRLGHGKGYYDRFLSEHPCSFTVGIAFSVQKASFPVETHDVPLTKIIAY